MTFVALQIDLVDLRHLSEETWLGNGDTRIMSTSTDLFIESGIVTILYLYTWSAPIELVA